MSQSAAPWEQPDEATRAAANPIEESLEAALRQIDTPAKADALVARLAEDVAGQEVEEVTAPTPPLADAPPQIQAARAAAAVQAAQARAPDGPIPEAAAAIERIAQEAATLEGPAYEALVAAVQEVTDPALQGQPEKLERPRRYLRDAIMQRMSFFQKYDTALFIAINNGLHTPALNGVFQGISFIFNGGWAWLLGVAALWPVRPQETKHTLKHLALPVWVAALGVEGPVKKYFRRRRPFIDVVRAVVVGKKPGNWSFPSGHAAAAFGGARIMSRCFPRWAALWHGIAALVGFSRIYLGAHYPGDVLSGSLVGALLAEGTHALMRRAGWVESE